MKQLCFGHWSQGRYRAIGGEGTGGEARRQVGWSGAPFASSKGRLQWQASSPFFSMLSDKTPCHSIPALPLHTQSYPLRLLN